MVFYRKYRPQTFAEIIGQEQVKQSLQQALLAGSVAHACLFCGPRGCGKTSTARILAKALNCEKRQLTSDKEQLTKKTGLSNFKNARTQNPEPRTYPVEPCNQCDSCIAITNGSHLDVIEIDAASNRGIDDVRELRERIKLSPSQGKKKVYIIDEVHMLTTEAFNALLKTLEEPPPHAIIILATTEPQKLPLTIISRCHRYNFSLANVEEMTQAIEAIIKKEKLKVEKEALAFLVEKAEGSFRDGVKLLDQVQGGEQKITLDQITQYYRAPGVLAVADFITLLLQGDEQGCLAMITTLYTSGENLHEFTLAIVRYLREVAFIQAGLGEVQVKPNKTASQYQHMLGHAEKLGRDQLLQLLKLCMQAQKDSKVTTIAPLPLELLVIEWIQQLQGSVVAGKQQAAPASEKESPAVIIVKPLSTKEVVDDSSAIVPVTPDDIKPEEVGAMLAEKSDSIEISTKAIPKEELEEVVPITEKTKIVKRNGASNIATIEEKWPAFLQKCQEHNHSVTLLLKNAAIKQFDGQNLTLEVFYKFHKERLENEKIRKVAETALEQVFGEKILLACVLSGKPKPKRRDTQEDLRQAAFEIFGAEEAV